MSLFIVAGIVIVFLVFLFLFVAIDLAMLPGKIARARGHRQADAVQVAGIIGLASGVLWPFAFAWAYYKPADDPAASQPASPGESPPGAQPTQAGVGTEGAAS